MVFLRCFWLRKVCFLGVFWLRKVCLLVFFRCFGASGGAGGDGCVDFRPFLTVLGCFGGDFGVLRRFWLRKVCFLGVLA
jgi:hypothetical protein